MKDKSTNYVASFVPHCIYTKNFKFSLIELHEGHELRAGYEVREGHEIRLFQLRFRYNK